MKRPRIRDLGVTIGRLPAGPSNAITDVPGVLVGHTTVLQDHPCLARTGVTVIVPCQGRIWEEHLFAGCHVVNGHGEMTGLLRVRETGTLCSPIGLTGTLALGVVYDALQRPSLPGFGLPVVAETADTWLNGRRWDLVTRGHVEAALRAAAGGPVAEGNVGGGTGMICHQFKGGIGTSSRRVTLGAQTFTVGALVQANHGARDTLRVDGCLVGRLLGPDKVPLAIPAVVDKSSVILVLATDAPLLPTQCERLARQGCAGLLRSGGGCAHFSGDIALAFSTGNVLPVGRKSHEDLRALDHAALDPLFHAAADAVEESILNALTAAETLTGWEGRTAHALPLDALQAILQSPRRLTPSME